MQYTTGKEEAEVNSFWEVKDGPPGVKLMKWVFEDEDSLPDNRGIGWGTRKGKRGKRNKM